MTSKTCIYYITFKCNDSCEYCQIWDSKELQNVAEAPVEKHLENIQAARRANAKILEIVGGEPLLYPDLPKVLERAKRFDFTVNLTTNGILYKERAKELKGLTDNIFFLLDYPVADEHDRSRGTVSFNNAVSSIKIAQEMNENPAIKFNITRDSVRFLPEMIELAQSLKARVYIRQVTDSHGFKGFDPATFEHIKYFFKKPEAVINLGELEFLKNHGNSIVFPRCRADRATITYLPDASRASPCFYNKGGRCGRENVCYGCVRSEYMLPSFKLGIDKYRFLDWYSGWLNSKKSS